MPAMHRFRIGIKRDIISHQSMLRFLVPEYCSLSFILKCLPRVFLNLMLHLIQI